MKSGFDIKGLGRAAQRHARRALRLGGEGRLVDALINRAEAETSSLSRNAAGVYLHAHRDVLDALQDAGEVSEGDYRAAEARIAALAARVDPKVPARTSAKKAKSLSAAELRDLFYALEAKAMTDQSMPVALVALLIVALVILGARPVEVTTLRHAGEFLRIENAKRSRRAPRFRFFRVAALPPAWLQAILLATAVHRNGADAAGFHAWHCHLAQILARVSQQVLGRRISFYTMRHVSLAPGSGPGFPRPISLCWPAISASGRKAITPAPPVAIPARSRSRWRAPKRFQQICLPTPMPPRRCLPGRGRDGPRWPMKRFPRRPYRLSRYPPT